MANNNQNNNFNSGLILLVEDDPFLSSVLQLKLGKENFKVIRQRW